MRTPFLCSIKGQNMCSRYALISLHSFWVGKWANVVTAQQIMKTGFFDDESFKSIREKKIVFENLAKIRTKCCFFCGIFGINRLRIEIFPENVKIANRLPRIVSMWRYAKSRSTRTFTSCPTVPVGGAKLNFSIASNFFLVQIVCLPEGKGENRVYGAVK